MSISADRMKADFLSRMSGKGYSLSNQMVQDIAEILAEVVKKEITTYAEVPVTKGDSAGVYKVQ